MRWRRRERGGAEGRGYENEKPGGEGRGRGGGGLEAGVRPLIHGNSPLSVLSQLPHSEPTLYSIDFLRTIEPSGRYTYTYST
jgi:hypothetical protein